MPDQLTNHPPRSLNRAQDSGDEYRGEPRMERVSMSAQSTVPGQSNRPVGEFLSVDLDRGADGSGLSELLRDPTDRLLRDACYLADSPRGIRQNVLFEGLKGRFAPDAGVLGGADQGILSYLGIERLRCVLRKIPHQGLLAGGVTGVPSVRPPEGRGIRLLPQEL